MSFPLYLVDNGSSVREDMKTLSNYSDSCDYVDILTCLKGRDGESDGFGNQSREALRRLTSRAMSCYL